MRNDNGMTSMNCYPGAKDFRLHAIKPKKMHYRKIYLINVDNKQQTNNTEI